MWNPAPDPYVCLRCCRRCAESVYFLNLESQYARYGQPELNGTRSVASLGLEATYPTSERLDPETGLWETSVIFPKPTSGQQRQHDRLGVSGCGTQD